VTDVIVLKGINDIGQTVGITAQDLINLAGYQVLANAVDLSQLKTATCASASAPRFSCANGRLTGRGLGPVTLGMTRARARSRFADGWCWP
jgi:hypothetical protein